jgi:hypothetical protein
MPPRKASREDARARTKTDDAANGFPDQSARGAGSAGASFDEGGFPPRETGRVEGAQSKKEKLSLDIYHE